MKTTAKYEPARRDSLPVVRSGYVDVREGNNGWWRQKWAVLKDDTLRFQASPLKPKDRISLTLSGITKVERSLVKTFCIHIELTTTALTDKSGSTSRSTDQSFFLSFKAESELYEWLDDIHTRSPLGCSNPFSFEHRVHVEYDQRGYTGLPPQWTALRRSSLSPFIVSPTQDTFRRGSGGGDDEDELGVGSNEKHSHDEKRRSVGLGGAGSTLSRVVSTLSRVSRRLSTTSNDRESTTFVSAPSISKRFSAPPGQMTPSGPPGPSGSRHGPGLGRRTTIGHIRKASLGSQHTFMGTLGAVKETDGDDVFHCAGDEIRKEEGDHDEVVMRGECLVNVIAAGSASGVLGLMKMMIWQRRMVLLTKRTLVVVEVKGWPRDQQRVNLPLSNITSVGRLSVGSKPNELVVQCNPSTRLHMSFERDSDLYDWQDAITHRSRCSGISPPSNFRHHVHVGCDVITMNYTGLPDEWQRILQAPHILAPPSSDALYGPIPSTQQEQQQQQQSRSQLISPPPAYHYHRPAPTLSQPRRPRTAPTLTTTSATTMTPATQGYTRPATATATTHGYAPPSSLESEIRRDVVQVGHVEGGYIERARRMKYRSDTSTLLPFQEDEYGAIAI